MTAGSFDSSHLLATGADGSEKSGPTRQPPNGNNSTTASMRRVRPRGLADMRGLALNRQPPPPSTARRDRSCGEPSGQNHLSPAPRTKAQWVSVPARRLAAGQSRGKFALNCPCAGRYWGETAGRGCARCLVPPPCSRSPSMPSGARPLNGDFNPAILCPALGRVVRGNRSRIAHPFG